MQFIHANNNDIIWKDCYPKTAIKYRIIAEKLLETDPESRSISNEGGYQSIDDLNHRSDFQELIDIIETQANVQIHEELELIKDVKFTVINMWANINWKGNYNSFHAHVNPPSQNRIANTPILSGVFYVNVPENSGRIGFSPSKVNYQKIGLDAPRVQIPEIFLKNIDNPLLNSVYYVEPQEGDLLIFFSDHIHGVEQSNAKDTDRRISISFNLGLELIDKEN